MTAPSANGGPPRLAVLGAGTMGAGIAALACLSGVPTVLRDVDATATAQGTARVRETIGAARRRGRIDEAAAAGALALLAPGAGFDDLPAVAVALEAVPERLELKRALLARVGAALPEAVLATNTSSLAVAAIAAGLPAPERVLGLHFFNPPAAMRLVELVRAPATSAAALGAAAALAQALGRTVVEVADGPGFLVNRCARPFYLEALQIAEEGAATPAEVDLACRAGGFPMGPFELMDLVGLDVSLAVTRSMFEQSGGVARWQPSPLQERLVAEGRLGRKSGAGFYAYGEGAQGPPAPAPPAPGFDPAGDRLLLRIVAALVNEAAFAVEAGVAAADDVDLAMTLGLRHPRGPFAWRDRIGAAPLVAVLDELAARGEERRYRVASSLRSAAAGASAATASSS